MNKREIYEQKLAAREAELDHFLQMEQRKRERTGRGFRHPFYREKIRRLLDITIWLQQQIDKMDVEAGQQSPAQQKKTIWRTEQWQEI